MNSTQVFPALTYLEAYFQVLAELRAAAQFAVQTLVNEAVQLIRAVTTVVLMVTEQRLIHTVPVVAGVSSVVAFLLCSMKEGNKRRETVNQCFSPNVLFTTVRLYRD